MYMKYRTDQRSALSSIHIVSLKRKLTFETVGQGLSLVPKKISKGEGGAYCVEMHVSRCMSVANEIISNRLFQEIREKRGLVYSIGFSWRPYRLLSGGYCTITFMPKFDQVQIHTTRFILYRIFLWNRKSIRLTFKNLHQVKLGQIW